MGNLKNLATGTVLTAPSPATSGTSVVLQAGEGAYFPATPFYAVAHPDGSTPTWANAELIQVTAISTDTLTIVRAQLTSTAKTIAVTWRISNPFLKEDYDAKQDLSTNLTAFASKAAPSGTVVGTTDTQTLSAKTLTTPVINGTSTGTGVSPTPAASIISMWDANLNYSANAFIPGFTTTATAAGTTTLTIASTGIQVFTGSSTQTVKLPTTSVVAGAQYLVLNSSTGAVTVQSSGANTITILAAGTSALFTAVVATPTTAANWSSQYIGSIVASGKSLSASNTLTLAGTDGTTMTFPGSSDTVAGLAAVQTITGAWSFNDGKLILKGATSGTTTLKSGATAGSSVITLPVATDTLVGKDTIDTLTNKTLTTPTIGSFTNATHNHTNAAGGGTLDLSTADTTAWASWTGTVVGWSSTTTATKYFRQVGKTVFFIIRYAGTSNSSTTTFTLPVAAATGMVTAIDGALGLTQDVGTVVAAGRWSIDTTAGTQVIACFVNQGGGGFNASGSKEVRLQGFYPAA